MGTRIILTLTSITPIFITLLIGFKENLGIFDVLICIAVITIILFAAVKVLKLAKLKLENIPVKIDEVSYDNNNNIIIYIFIYLIPLLSIDIEIELLLLTLFIILLFSTKAYYFNPILGILGYNQYKIKVNGISFILISKRDLIKIKQIKKVVELYDCILLEK